MDGLASAMAQPQMAPTQAPMTPAGNDVPQGAPGDGGAMPTVEEIVQLLMQGVDPQELVDMGVPPELIMEAIQIIEAQMAAESAPQQEQGLAAQSAMSM